MSFSSLPADISRNRLLDDLSIDDLLRLCQVNRSYAQLCNNPSFWSRLLLQRFGVIYSGKLSRFLAVFLSRVGEIPKVSIEEIVKLFSLLESLNLPVRRPTLSRVPSINNNFGWEIRFPIGTRAILVYTIGTIELAIAGQRHSSRIQFVISLTDQIVPYLQQIIEGFIIIAGRLPRGSQLSGDELDELVAPLMKYLNLAILRYAREMIGLGVKDLISIRW